MCSRSKYLYHFLPLFLTFSLGGCVWSRSSVSQNANEQLKTMLSYAAWVVAPSIVIAVLCALIAIFTDDSSRRDAAGAVGAVALLTILVSVLLIA
jgi:heme/copper-type cytochrome/quinol oxidase subunit 2